LPFISPSQSHVYMVTSAVMAPPPPPFADRETSCGAHGRASSGCHRARGGLHPPTFWDQEHQAHRTRIPPPLNDRTGILVISTARADARRAEKYGSSPGTAKSRRQRPAVVVPLRIRSFLQNCFDKLGLLPGSERSPREEGAPHDTPLPRDRRPSRLQCGPRTPGARGSQTHIHGGN